MTDGPTRDARGAVPDAEIERHAVVTESLVKRYSSAAKSFTAVPTFSSAQLKNFLPVIFGRTPKNVVALDSVSLSIDKGEVFGILGPNGAGKTTLIKILSTLVLPDGGRAFIHGIDVARRPRAALQKLQTVLAESVGFERRLTGRQNLEFYAELYGIPLEVARPKITSLLDMVGLTEQSHWMFNRYSTGMARKLLLCRALMSDASVLIFDEPTSGLDPNAAFEFRHLIREVISREKGKTVLLASHNLWEVQQICDRVVVLKNGRVIAVGSPMQISDGSEENVSLTIVGRFPNGQSSALLESELRGSPGILKCSVQPGLHEGGVSITVEGSRDFDYNSLFVAVLSHKFKITSLDVSKGSLEEAYIKLTGEGGPWSFQ